MDVPLNIEDWGGGGKWPLLLDVQHGALGFLGGGVMLHSVMDRGGQQIAGSRGCSHRFACLM